MRSNELGCGDCPTGRFAVAVLDIGLSDWEIGSSLGVSWLGRLGLRAQGLGFVKFRVWGSGLEVRACSHSLVSGV